MSGAGTVELGISADGDGVTFQVFANGPDDRRVVYHFLRWGRSCGVLPVFGFGVAKVLLLCEHSAGHGSVFHFGVGGGIVLADREEAYIFPAVLEDG